MERAAALTGFAGRAMIAAGYERPRAEGDDCNPTEDPSPLTGCLDAANCGGIPVQVERTPRGGFGLFLTDGN
jgi:hypothetical protein